MFVKKYFFFILVPFFSFSSLKLHCLFSLFIVTVPSEEVVIRKERSAGSYRLSAYFLAKCLSEIPLVICYPIIFLFIFYWLCGLNPSFAFLGQALNVVTNAILSQVCFLFLYYKRFLYKKIR